MKPTRVVSDLSEVMAAASWLPTDGPIPLANITIKQEMKQVPRLYSVAHEHCWEPGCIETGDIEEWIDLKGSFDTVPGGVYAWKTCDCALLHLHHCKSYMDEYKQRIEELRKEYEANPDWIRMMSFVGWKPYVKAVGVALGSVKLWGEVVTHEEGYRATHAKLNSIHTTIGDVSVDELCSAYRIPRLADYTGAPWQDED